MCHECLVVLGCRYQEALTMLAMPVLAVPAAAAAAHSQSMDGAVHHVSVWGAPPPKWWSWMMTESTQVLE